jgi:UDP-3-O-[3-hydroxymyristoyl] glucosamine N-acyltransferase
MNVHPTASVHPEAHVAPSATIGPFAVIGAHSIIGHRCTIGAAAQIGRGVRVQHWNAIGDGAVLEDRCIIAKYAAVPAETTVRSYQLWGSQI